MSRGPRIVAAALLGAAATGLLVGSLAFSPSSRGAEPQVTLQIAPRAPGTAGASVTSDTPGVELDPPDEGQSVSACTGKSTEESSCHWGFPRGTIVKLTAAASSGDFAGWSTPDCPGTGSCTLTLDDDYTSVAALFDPLLLGVRFSHPRDSDPPADRHITSDPAGIDCRPSVDDPTGENNPGCTHPFKPNTPVQLTATGANFTKWKGGASGDFCEPVNATTCTIWVVDYTSWAAAIYGTDEEEPNLATTIKVQFQVRKGGDGSGRVTSDKLDCGSQCSAEYTYGRRLTLTAQRSEGSAFGGWNGVCSRTQTTCTFSAGPLTRIRALFTDATPPSTPTGLKVTNATRSSVTIDWTASTDNVRVTGYRVYLEGASLADVTATGYTLAGASCGRSYGVSVDAVDGAGNRSQRATLRAATKACSLVARMVGVRVVYASGRRTVAVRLQSNRTTTARLTLSRKGRARARGSYRVRPGSNLLRLPVRRSVRAGLYQLKIAVVDPDGGRTRVFTRRVRLRLAR